MINAIFIFNKFYLNVRILGAIKKYHLDIINGKNPEESHRNLLKLIVACTPVIKETGLLKFLLMWKVVVAIQIIGVPKNNLASGKEGVMEHSAIISNAIEIFVGTVLKYSSSEQSTYGTIIT